MATSIINFLLFSGLLYFLYILLFRNRSFFQINRIYLLMVPVISLGLSWIAPYFNDPVYSSTGFSTTLLPFSVEISPDTTLLVKKSTNPWMILYIGGVCIGALIFAINLIRVLYVLKRAEKRDINGIAVKYSREINNPFAFFGSIVLPAKLSEQASLPVILKHEYIHKSQKHSLDNLFYNLLSIVFWFNPFIHLLSRETRQIHECIADRETLKETSREVYIQMLLSSTFSTDVVPVTIGANSFFNSSLIKSRIIMLYKKENPKWLKASYLVLLPLVTVMALHACNKVQEEKTAVSEKTIDMAEVDQPPLFANCEAGAEKAEMAQCFGSGIMSHIGNNLKYPESAREAGVSGKVFVKITINSNGDISEAEVKRGIIFTDDAGNKRSPSSEEARAAEAMEASAIEVVRSLPELKPAQKDGKSVNVSYIIPINYAL